jgi:hypothetical protein
VTLRVIAFEGKRNAHGLVSWGAAALRQDDELINPTTGLRLPFSDEHISDLASDGALTVLDKPIDVDDEFAASPMIVLEIRLGEFEEVVRVSMGRVGGVVRSAHRAEYNYYIFQNRIAFDQYKRGAVAAILHELFYEPLGDEKAGVLLGAGLTLDPHNPGLGALRVSRSKNPHITQAIAVASLRSDEDRRCFHELLDAIRSEDNDYVLKYQDGIASGGGGLDTDQAARILGAMTNVHQLFAKQLKTDFPFLQTPPAARLHELRAASAEFHFTPQVTDRPFGEKVARYLELKLLQKAISGTIPKKLEHSEPFREALLQIVQPDDATVVNHRPFGEERLAPIKVHTFDVEAASPTWSYPLVLLGYQSGLIREARRIEINIFPGRRLSLSAEDDGAGQLPLGLAFLKQRNDFLFKPNLYTVVRHMDEHKSETFYLQAVQTIEPGKVYAVTAIPSSVLSGAFVHKLDLEVRRSSKGDIIELPVDRIDGVNAVSLPDAQRWMATYADACRHLELADMRQSRLAPARMPPPSVLIQILSALEKLGGSANQIELVTTVNKLYGKSMRANNTRREVHRNKRLLEFAGATDIKITVEGSRFLRAYQAIERRAK